MTWLRSLASERFGFLLPFKGICRWHCGLGFRHSDISVRHSGSSSEFKSDSVGFNLHFGRLEVGVYRFLGGKLQEVHKYFFCGGKKFESELYGGGSMIVGVYITMRCSIICFIFWSTCFVTNSLNHGIVVHFLQQWTPTLGLKYHHILSTCSLEYLCKT